MKHLLAAGLLALLAGCLEVDQHPPWRDGAYDGKTDMRTPQRRFAGDSLGWNAVIDDRTRLQDEYPRVLHGANLPTRTTP